MMRALPLCAGALVAPLYFACGTGEEAPAEFEPNHPPQILESTAVVSGRHGAFVELQTACPLWFEAVVSDRDVDDRVEFRWYVTALDEEPPVPAVVWDGVLQNTGEWRRPPLRVDFKEGLPVNPLASPGMYLVQLMVFDGALRSSAGPGSVPDPEPIPDSDGGLDARHSTSYAWTVKIVPGSSCVLGAP